MALFRLSPQQFTAMQHAAEREFNRSVVRAVRREQPLVVLRIVDDVLEGMVRAGISRARGHGLTLDTAITAFVLLMFEVSPNFDEHPVIRWALRVTEGTPDERFFALRTVIAADDWQEARDSSDPKTWSEGHATGNNWA